MKISFFGHRNFINDQNYEKRVLEILFEIENSNQGEQLELLLGGYGSFDKFALQCARKFKASVKNVTITLVTPYIIHGDTEEYDIVLYPSLENVPKKFAITHRNRRMVDISDLIIAFIDHKFGGAYDAVKYAKSKNKTIVNLSDFEIYYKKGTE